MGIYQKIGTKIVFILLLLFSVSSPVAGETYSSFDDFPATAPNAIPGSGGVWLYSSGVTNVDTTYPMGGFNIAGWRAAVPYPGTSSIFDFFYLSSVNINSAHRGWENYGYLEIDNMTAVKGHSLRYIVTGGKNSITGPDVGNGLYLHTKEEYLNYLANGQQPVEGNIKVGTPLMYFANSGGKDANSTPLDKAKGANRLSFYLYSPASHTNGSGGYGIPPGTTYDVGPYSAISKSPFYPNTTDPTGIIGGHWYHRVHTQGGGWTHVVIGGHPSHSNTFSSESQYPYPSRSWRNIGTEYFDSMWRFYIAAGPYEGIGVPEFSMWLDEIEFQYDAEPQNNETINDPTVMYRPAGKQFEIGFNDKYTNNEYNWGTFEVRYSFSPITNASWNGATPVHIQADSRFDITATTTGRFSKHEPYYKHAWAPFKIAPADESKLTPGNTIYFAIKDMSQEGGNGQNPVGGDLKAGRRYADFPSRFDYAGDKDALLLIKRIDYYIANESSPDTVPPLAPKDLVITLGQ